MDIFNAESINFYDEEIVAIANSGGLLGLQMDRTIHTGFQKQNKTFAASAIHPSIRGSAIIIWNQLQYIAHLLDSQGIFCWGITAVGSDFDGSINPFPGILTAENFKPLSEELCLLANRFQEQQTLSLPENKNISPEEIIDHFFYGNLHRFLENNYR